jgi:hypothetical protein
MEDGCARSWMSLKQVENGGGGTTTMDRHYSPAGTLAARKYVLHDRRLNRPPILRTWRVIEADLPYVLRFNEKFVE